MKRIVSGLMAGILTLSMGCIPANAEICVESTAEVLSAEPTPSKTWGETSEGHSFTNAWEESRYLYVNGMSNAIGQMKYGYNTAFINEDYCSCYFVDHQSSSAISQPNFHYEESGIEGPGVWSRIEIKHRDAPVSYYAKSYGAW